MDKATKEFLKGIDAQLHNDRVDAETGAKIVERLRTDPFYRDNEANMRMESIKKKNEMMKPMLEHVNEQLKNNARGEQLIYDSIMNLHDSNEGQSELGRLLEIEEHNLERIETRIADAEEREDQALIEKLSSEKAEVENHIAFYTSQQHS